MECFLSTASLLQVRTLRASHLFEERERVVRKFNNPNSDVQVLVTSLLVGATSYNLQNDCHHVVLVDVPTSTNQLLQAIGRVYRMGQKSSVRAWILTVDESFDQVTQAKSASKIIPQLAGQLDLTVYKDQLTKQHNLFVNEHRRRYPNSTDTPSLEDTYSRLRIEKLHECYRQMMGQRSQRHFAPWHNIEDFSLKNQLPGEQRARAVTPKRPRPDTPSISPESI